MSTSPLRKYQHPIISTATQDEVLEVIRSGKLSGFRGTGEGHLGGEKVQKFEKAFAEYHNVRHAVSFCNATAALHASLLACGVGKGDEVITTPLTFSATASSILMVGAKVVFADVDYNTFNISPDELPKAIPWNVKAIIPVHLMGNPCNMDSIMEYRRYGVPIIEDASQALGAEYHGKKVGTFGKIGVFSFNQSKPISTGEGGMAITDDYEIAKRLRAIRNHGEVSVPHLGFLGYNYRMGEIEAVLGLKQLEQIDEMNQLRIDLAGELSKQILKVNGLLPSLKYARSKHVYYTYGVIVDPQIGRDNLQNRLLKRDVYFGQGGYKPLYKFPIYQTKKQFPNAEYLYKNMMFTDIIRYPMKRDDVLEMARIIKEEVNGLET